MNYPASVALQRQGENPGELMLEELLGFSSASLNLSADELTSQQNAISPASTFLRQIQRKDGSFFRAEVTCAQFSCQAQRFTIIHFCDVSTCSAAATRLQLISSALEQIADHAVITDANGTILYVNRAFQEGTGFARSEAVGKPISIIKSGRHGAVFYSDLWSTLRSGEVFRGEMVNRRAQGDLYVTEQVISPFVDPDTGATFYIATGRDITERRFRDPLTGLPTRTALVDRLAQSIARAERSPNTSHFALAFIDLDRFKDINDAHGNLLGDQVLLEVACRIRTTVRKVDAVAQVSRLDRDEFAVLLEDLRNDTDVRCAIQRVIDAIREPIVFPGGPSIVVAASVGIASLTAEHRTPETLLQDAETAMRRAKATPDEPCQVFDLVMHKRAQNRLRIESELRTALARDEFVLHYQPIVSLLSGRITSCEALVRWIHPTRGFVPPLEFIGIAEESGLIIALGQQVIEKACKQARSWQAMGFADLSVAVNVSTRQFSEGQLLDRVETTLKATGLAPSLLKIEITESAAATNPEGAVRILSGLKSLGVELLIDDFGTGYSSLSRLTQFPLNKLKIDRAFVMQISENDHDNAVASTIVAMAHSLGLGVIAEGVETQNQATFLRSIRCEEMQGYLFSKPVAASDFEHLLRTDKRLSVDASLS
jgi:diguanylate cyclase (GGDEF)-like protein/PAS domain S-box-containing protein